MSLSEVEEKEKKVKKAIKVGYSIRFIRLWFKSEGSPHGIVTFGLMPLGKVWISLFPPVMG